MRLIYPVLWARPGRQACRGQTMATVAALARAGHEVTLLMPRGRDDPWLDAAELRGYFAVEGDFRVVQRASRWEGEWLPRTLMWLRQVFADPELRGADLLYSRIPAMLAMGHLAPLPFATDHDRPWPDDLPALRPLFRRTARHPRCAGLILHSRYAAESWRRIGVPEDRILVAHNGADLPPPMTQAKARSALGLAGDRPIALYAGRINPQKGLDQLLALAALRPAVEFLLVGSEGQGEIEAAAANRANVRVLPWAAPDALPKWLAAADVLLIPASRAPLERFRNCVLPIKVYSYLAAGRPILAPVAPDTAELLTQGETALLVPPGEPERAASALDNILGDSALAARLGGNARSLAAELSWERRAEKIGTFLEARLQRSAYSSTVTALSPNSSGAPQVPSGIGK